MPSHLAADRADGTAMTFQGLQDQTAAQIHEMKVLVAVSSRQFMAKSCVSRGAPLAGAAPHLARSSSGRNSYSN